MSPNRAPASFRTTGSFIRKLWLYPRDVIRWYLDSLWDRKRNVDTSGKTKLTKYKIPNATVADATWYEPVPTLGFRKLLGALAIDFRQFTFIDYGSGKGRALFLASDYPSKEIIGIEFSRELNDNAIKNIKRYRNPRQRTSKITSVCADAIDYKLPSGDCVLFFYSPFRAALLTKVIDNIKREIAAQSRDVYIVFIGYIPESIAVFKNCNIPCVEVAMGMDYLRWETKRGLILHHPRS